MSLSDSLHMAKAERGGSPLAASLDATASKRSRTRFLLDTQYVVDAGRRNEECRPAIKLLKAKRNRVLLV